MDKTFMKRTCLRYILAVETNEGLFFLEPSEMGATITNASYKEFEQVRGFYTHQSARNWFENHAEDYKTLFHNHKIEKNMILEVESLSVAFELFTLPHPSKTT